MDIYAVFNELSVASPATPNGATVHDARKWVADFSRLLYEAQQRGVGGLRTYRHIHEIQLIDGYSLMDWANDQTVDLELRLRIKTRFTELSLLTEFPENQQGDPLFECRHAGCVAYGIGAAHLLDSLAISLLSEARWDTPSLPISLFEIVEEAPDGRESDHDLRHISTITHLPHHQHWIDERRRTSVRNGRDLWNKTKQWYPHLIFCDNAKKQILALRTGTRQLRRVVERLFELERYCTNSWVSGGFDGSKISNSSGESKLTLAQYGQQREFICPDGRKRLFEWHLKGIPDAWRIHIWPDEETHTILVGYIGEHLPTVNDPT